jgi:PAS domain S-box-containing protein
MSPVNILIVDDREENIIALEALLNRNDIHIFSTTSPNEALKIAWDNQISIALVDVQMPEMDGFELVEMLKSNPRTKDIMVIFVTAISKEAKYAVKGLGTGAVDYLFKPLDPYITSAKVDSFIQLARYQAEIRKKNEELQNFALVVKNSADIICTIDAQNLSIQSINPAVEKLLGIKAERLEGKSILDMVIEPEQAAFKKKLGEMIKDNLSFAVFEFQFSTFDKRSIWAECRASIRNKVIFLNISDISPSISYQNQLIKSKEAAEYSKKVKETFLANMSHELRTPITGIIGLVSLLKKTDPSDQQNTMLNLLETSSQSLLGVINDVLDISKIEAGKFNIVRSANNLYDLANAVYNLLKFKADKKEIELFLEIEPSVPKYIMVDSLRLNQILMNLLSNAINFTDRGYVKLKIALVKDHKEKVKLKFSVEDSGIGIASDKLKTIFDSFEQAEDNTTNKYGGTGLGLTIVKKLVELKGGELSVSSQIGKGSVFSFTNWFVVTDRPKNSSVTPDKTLAPFDNISVLVAEDNMVNQFVLAKLLKDWSIDVDMVDNGRKVIEKLRVKDYDLILMDTHMPEMNGYEATKMIRFDFEGTKRNIPIISLSAAMFDNEKVEAIAVGMNDVLQKPFQPYQLHDIISKVLNSVEVVKKPV